MNPLKENTKDINDNFIDIKNMYAKAYNKNKTSPYTKTRIILLNGTEFESNWFMHQFARNCDIDEIKQELAVVRKQEQQQQKRIASLKPINESILETTIAYEQLAIDLTATLAQNETDKNNIEALNFALLEDFDHLYRFANLLAIDKGLDSATLVGKYTEIMPGRPTISEHRYAKDDVKKPMNSKKSKLYSKLVANIITAAEQQTMNYYMNIAQWYKNDLGRKLYSEIGMIEEQHVSQYESLKDPTCSWLEQWVMHEYTECYLYYSSYEEETDNYIKNIWKEHYLMEVAHLKKAIELLEKYEKKNYKSVIGDGEFPTLLKHGTNKEYVRNVISRTINLTGNGTSYIDINKLDNSANYFKYQKIFIKNLEDVPSHLVINKAIQKLGKDYRYQDSPHPIKELNSRTKDNVNVARTKN
ncbi:MAG: hypothetical protein E7359_02910 [Clostridiales bacterium]|nr:hypothetical protein [Clostridiales bacterium]